VEHDVHEAETQRDLYHKPVSSREERAQRRANSSVPDVAVAVAEQVLAEDDAGESKAAERSQSAAAQGNVPEEVNAHEVAAAGDVAGAEEELSYSDWGSSYVESDNEGGEEEKEVKRADSVGERKEGKEEAQERRREERKQRRQENKRRAVLADNPEAPVLQYTADKKLFRPTIREIAELPAPIREVPWQVQPALCNLYDMVLRYYMDAKEAEDNSAVCDAVAVLHAEVTN
jgi:hypothetical protein